MTDCNNPPQTLTASIGGKCHETHTHTPGRLVVHPDQIGGIDTEDGRPFASVQPVSAADRHEKHATRQALCAELCRRWNAHDAPVSACDDVLAELDQYSDGEEIGPRAAEHMRGLLRAALKAARE